MNTQIPASPKDRVKTRRPGGVGGPSLQGDKYHEMRRAILQALAGRSHGIESRQLHQTVKPLLSESVYGPDCLTSWYCVQVVLDLEARGHIRRVGDSDERFVRVGDA